MITEPQKGLGGLTMKNQVRMCVITQIKSVDRLRQKFTICQKERGPPR